MQETLHLLAKNSRESSSRGYSLRSGQASLSAEPVSSLHTVTASSVNGHTMSPIPQAFQKARRAQQPSLLDLCPTVFGAISPDLHNHQSSGAAPVEEVPAKEDERKQGCLSTQPHSPNSRAMSLTSLCPSIEHLLDGAEDGPIEAACSQSSPDSSPYSATVRHPKCDAHAPQSMLDLQPSVIGCFGSSSSDKSSNAPGPDPDEPETHSGLSACLRSTIPAFHQGPEPDAMSEPSLATDFDSGAGAVTVFCNGVASTLPRDPDMLRSMPAGTECTDELSRSIEFGIQSSATGRGSTLDGWLNKAPSLLQHSRSMCESTAPAAVVGGDDDFDGDNVTPLRRAKSLAPTRRSMLTPAADCNGGHLLPEVPALQTYKNARPPRPRHAHFKSTVVILDNPTVNVFEANADTASMTVSAVSQPRSDSAQHSRRQRNRRRGSYVHMRSALDYAELGRHVEPRLEPLRESGSGPDGRASRASSPDEPFPCRGAEPRATMETVGGCEEPRSLSGTPCPIRSTQV